MLTFIHNFVPGKLPSTVLVLHGQGGDENDLLPIARALAPGAAFLSPRGKAVEAGMSRFFARVSPDVFDETEVRTRTAELAEWIGAAVAVQTGSGESVRIRFFERRKCRWVDTAAASGCACRGAIAAAEDDHRAGGIAGSERRACAGDRGAK